MTLKTSCSCGQLSIDYDGEITRTTVCHCFACQKRTGSPFAVATRLDRSRITINGNSTVYKRKGDEGSEISFHFCPECGSTVYYEADWLGDSIAAPIGGFNKPDLPTPVMDVYRNRKHQWVQMPESIPEFHG